MTIDRLAKWKRFPDTDRAVCLLFLSCLNRDVPQTRVDISQTLLAAETRIGDAVRICRRQGWDISGTLGVGYTCKMSGEQRQWLFDNVETLAEAF